jgi:hypothetical protein
MRASIVIIATLAVSSAASATPEVCGDGIDNNGNGMADEGCWPSEALGGVCESPMSCKTTGYIAPKTGDLVYQLPPDLNPTVPYGPALQFKRTYMSAYAPPSTNYRTAMGPRWQHNFQSWLDKSGTTVIVHLPSGRDVLFTYSTTISGFDYYVGQPGYFVTNPPTGQGAYLRQATTSPNNWELRTLTGEKYVFNWSSPTGKLIEIDDSLATPNKVTIAYLANGGNKGQIDTITDASGHKRFKFSYSGGEVSEVDLQTVSGGTATTRVALTFVYTSTNPTTVKIAGSTIQTNAYASNYLTSIQDASSNHVVDIAPVTATPAITARVKTGEGVIGLDYNSSNVSCTGQTLLGFNLATGTACNADSDCGSTYKCVGHTGTTGMTGQCFRGARCLTVSSPSEDLITTVNPVTPCTGSCAPTAQYSWDTTTLKLKGIKRATGNWTSFARDGNGMVTMMAEGDTDDDPTNGGGKDTWIFYGNSSFPGRMTEKRSPSSVQLEGVCDGVIGDTAGCKRTQYTWNADGLLGTREDDGWSYNASGTLTSFANTTSFTYDKGRLTQIDGPLSGSDDITMLTYWTSTDVFKDGYLNTLQRKKDSSNFVTTTIDSYDYFGNAQSTQDPDGTFTCRTWDANRNFLSQVRVGMNGQTDCSTINSLDLTT